MLHKLLRHHIFWDVNRAHENWLAWKDKSSLYSNFAVTKLEYMEVVADARANPPEVDRPWRIGQTCGWHVHADTPKCKYPAYEELIQRLNAGKQPLIRRRISACFA